MVKWGESRTCWVRQSSFPHSPRPFLSLSLPGSIHLVWRSQVTLPTNPLLKWALKKRLLWEWALLLAKEKHPDSLGCVFGGRTKRGSYIGRQIPASFEEHSSSRDCPRFRQVNSQLVTSLSLEVCKQKQMIICLWND